MKTREQRIEDRIEMLRSINRNRKGAIRNIERNIRKSEEEIMKLKGRFDVMQVLARSSAVERRADNAEVTGSIPVGPICRSSSAR